MEDKQKFLALDMKVCEVLLSRPTYISIFLVPPPFEFVILNNFAPMNTKLIIRDQITRKTIGYIYICTTLTLLLARLQIPLKLKLN